MAYPIWLQINIDIGIVLTYILMSAVYYGNLWRAKDFPFMSQAIFVCLTFLIEENIWAKSFRTGGGRFPVQPERASHERQV